MLAGGAVTNMIFEVGVNSSGLGRWCWIRFRGEEGIVSRIITAYQPVRLRRVAGINCYAQQRRYFLNKGDKGCPLDKFKHDLIYA